MIYSCINIEEIAEFLNIRPYNRNEMKKLVFSALAIGLIAFAHEGHEHGHPVTVTGEVVDTGCYVSHDGKGAKHAACAETCAKNGIPLAIVDDAGKLYLPLGLEHANPNTKLLPFVAKRVKVTGAEFDKGGLVTIAIKTIEPAQ